MGMFDDESGEDGGFSGENASGMFSEDRDSFSGGGSMFDEPTHTPRKHNLKDMGDAARRKVEQARELADRAKKIRQLKKVKMASRARWIRIIISLAGGGFEVLLVCAAVVVILGGVLALYSQFSEIYGEVAEFVGDLVENPGETLKEVGSGAYEAVEESITYCQQNDCSGLSGQGAPSPWSF